MSDTKKVHVKHDPNDRPEKEHTSDFEQENLSHFYAQHKPVSTIICLFIVAIIFIPVGAAIIVASDSIMEVDIRYDLINKYSYNGCTQNLVSYTQGSLSASAGCRARAKFTLDTAMTGEIYMYYRLVNFYQNYRPYAKSMSDDQLQGLEVDRSYLSDCSPYRSPGELEGDSTSTLVINTVTKKFPEMLYSPCGAVPWSMFNDTIGLYQVNSGSNATAIKDTPPATTLPAGNVTLICDGGAFGTNGVDGGSTTSKCDKKGIAFESDRTERFKTSHSDDKYWTGSGNAGSSNEYQVAGWYQNEIGHKLPVATDEDFIVWSRIAGLSDFRKLYRRLTTDLAAGDYILDIMEHYDVATFEGEKHVVLSTTSWVGGKNYILGGLFLMFGLLSVGLAVAFLIWFLVHGPNAGVGMGTKKKHGNNDNNDTSVTFPSSNTNVLASDPRS